MNRWTPVRLRSGQIIQAGLNVGSRNRTNPMAPKLGLYRGIVLNTRAPLQNDGENNPDVYRHYRVECDVILVKSQILLRNVPVQQPFHGINNAAPWVPKPTTRTISQNRALNFNVRSARGQFIGAVPGFDDLDGDMVIIQFVEGDPDHPMITGALVHEKTNRIVRAGGGWDEAGAGAERGAPEQDELYMHHKGAELRINNDGELLIDTVGAYTEASDESVTTDKGQVRIRLKNELKFTIECDGVDVLEVFKDAGGQVRVHFGEGATQRIVLGDDNKTAFDNFRTALTSWIALVKTGIEAGPGVLDNSAFTTAIAALGTEMANALSDLAKANKT